MTAPATPQVPLDAPGTGVSLQTKRNRSIGGRKAAAASRLRRLKYGPNGSHRGSDQVRFDIAETLARIRAAQDPAGRGG